MTRLGKKETVKRDIEMTWMLELKYKVFKWAIIEMLKTKNKNMNRWSYIWIWVFQVRMKLY